MEQRKYNNIYINPQVHSNNKVLLNPKFMTTTGVHVNPSFIAKSANPDSSGLQEKVTPHFTKLKDGYNTLERTSSVRKSGQNFSCGTSLATSRSKYQIRHNVANHMNKQVTKDAVDQNKHCGTSSATTRSRYRIRNNVTNEVNKQVTKDADQNKCCGTSSTIARSMYQIRNNVANQINKQVTKDADNKIGNLINPENKQVKGDERIVVKAVISQPNNVIKEVKDDKTNINKCLINNTNSSLTNQMIKDCKDSINKSSINQPISHSIIQRNKQNYNEANINKFNCDLVNLNNKQWNTHNVNISKINQAVNSIDQRNKQEKGASSGEKLLIKGANTSLINSKSKQAKEALATKLCYRKQKYKLTRIISPKLLKLKNVKPLQFKTKYALARKISGHAPIGYYKNKYKIYRKMRSVDFSDSRLNSKFRVASGKNCANTKNRYVYKKLKYAPGYEEIKDSYRHGKTVSANLKSKYSYKRKGSFSQIDASSKFKLKATSSPKQTAAPNFIQKSKYKLMRSRRQTNLDVSLSTKMANVVKSKYKLLRVSPKISHLPKGHYKKSTGKQESPVRRTVHFNRQALLLKQQRLTTKVAASTVFEARKRTHRTTRKSSKLKKIRGVYYYGSTKHVVKAGYVNQSDKKYSRIVRTTNVTAMRQAASQVLGRSRRILIKRKKKSSQLCLFFTRFGKCSRHDKEECPYVHDATKVAVCRRFLMGKCVDSMCLLSHKVAPEKMPTCSFFLRGICHKSNCPYLHVKVNPNANICADFVLHGYCSRERQCKLRHEIICPDFINKGHCHKGSKCPLPHQEKQKERKEQIKENKDLLSQKQEVEKREEIDGKELNMEEKEVSGRRYYEVEDDCSVIDTTKESGSVVSCPGFIPIN